MNNKPTTAGFSLIEIMITVVIIGILAAIAVPAYNNHFIKANREVAKQELLSAAQSMESFYALNMTLVGAVSGTEMTIYNTSDRFDTAYNLTATLNGTTQYTLLATPIPGTQQGQDSCGALSIDNFQQTLPTTDGCW